MREVPELYVGMVVYMHLSTALVTNLVRRTKGEVPQVTIHAGSRTLHHFVGTYVMESGQVRGEEEVFCQVACSHLNSGGSIRIEKIYLLYCCNLCRIHGEDIPFLWICTAKCLSMIKDCSLFV